MRDSNAIYVVFQPGRERKSARKCPRGPQDDPAFRKILEVGCIPRKSIKLNIPSIHLTYKMLQGHQCSQPS
jgi:hypothetical protein